ncbi:MAG: DUF58 domain-containing protein [Candidatus Sericytochromatia bacterium]
MILAIIPIFQAYVLIVVTIFLFLAATNIQGGWLFIIDSLLVSLIIFSAIYPSFQLKNLIITRKFKKSIQEDELLEIEVIIENISKKNISFIGLQENQIIKKNGYSIKLLGSSFFINILPNEQKKFSYTIKPDIRGIYNFSDLKIISDGPFGLFRYTKNISVKDSIYVYPNIESINYLDFQGNRNLSYKSTSKTKAEANSSIPVNIKDYKRGDSQKLIHWKSTARVGKLMVKELEAEQSLSVKIFIDTEKNKNYGTAKNNNFELLIKKAIAIFKYFYSKGYFVEILFYMNDKIEKIDNSKSEREINNIFSEIEPIEKNKFIDLINPTLLSKNSVNTIFFLDISDKEIDLLNDLYLSHFNIVPFIIKNEIMKNKNNNLDLLLSKSKYHFEII